MGTFTTAGNNPLTFGRPLAMYPVHARSGSCVEDRAGARRLPRGLRLYGLLYGLWGKRALSAANCSP